MSDLTSLDDLLESLARGDDQATQEVFERCESLLRLIIRRQLSSELRTRFDSEDILQSIWADLVVGFRAGNWKFGTSAELRAFLITAARHRLIDRARQHARQNRTESLDAQEAKNAYPGNTPTPSEFAQAHDLWDRLMAICSPEHRRIVELKREGLTLDEIAAETELHPSSVRRILYELARRLGDQESQTAEV